MDNYEVSKEQTPEEKDFQDRAKKAFDEIGLVLNKYNLIIEPTLQVTKGAIVASISVEEKPSNIINPPIIKPK